jgi:NitT/TauT family transport system permease protein
LSVQSPLPPVAADSPSKPAEPRAAVRFAKAALWPGLTFIGILVAWEISSRTGTINPIVLPPPTVILETFYGFLGEEFFWRALRITAWEAFAGFVIGVTGGWILGTLIGLVAYVRRAIYPLAVIFQTLPTVALAPLFMVWFGFGLTPRIAFSAMICFFPVLLAVIVGLRTVDPEAQTLMRSFGATRWQSYRKLVFPASLPMVFGGLKYSVTLALIGALVGEFVGGNDGMGVLINTFNNQLNIAESFAVVFTLSLVGVTFYGLVELLDRRLVFWRRDG